jgi:hypothetical protein
MTGKNNPKQPPQSASMVEDKAAERLKQRLQDIGLILNTGAVRPTKLMGKKKGGAKKGGK